MAEMTKAELEARVADLEAGIANAGVPSEPMDGESPQDFAKRLTVPASYAARKQWEAMKNAEVNRATGRDVVGRPADQPLQYVENGRLMLMQRDEREAKYEKPLAMLDFAPGQRPLMVVGGGTE